MIQRYDAQHHKLIFEIYEQSEEKSVKMVAKKLEDMKVVPKSEEQPDFQFIDQITSPKLKKAIITDFKKLTASEYQALTGSSRL